MTEEFARDEISRLEALVADEPGSPAFPALADAHRRAGRATEAERVARQGLSRQPDHPAGQVALGLALLDLGRVEEARRELERVLDAAPDHPVAASALESGRPPPDVRGWRSPPPPAPAEPPDLLEQIGEPEIDAAFDQASPEPTGVVNADTVAQAALHDLESEDEDRDDPVIPVVTQTVADLLERQGHAESARAMRESLDAAAPLHGSGEGETAFPTADPASRGQVVATLERWLESIRRGAR